MFAKHNRYVTRQIANQVSKELLQLIWDILDSFTSGHEANDLDYLQCFELSLEERNGHVMQRIIHRQEQPPFVEDTIFEVDQPIQGAIIIYDDMGKTILMFAEEY